MHARLHHSWLSGGLQQPKEIAGSISAAVVLHWHAAAALLCGTLHSPHLLLRRGLLMATQSRLPLGSVSSCFEVLYQEHGSNQGPIPLAPIVLAMPQERQNNTQGCQWRAEL